MADCVRDFDDFEDIDVTDCLPILPEQEGRSMRRSQEGRADGACTPLLSLKCFTLGCEANVGR